MSFVVGCCMLFVVGCCMLFVVCCLLIDVRWLLLVIDLLVVLRCLSLVVCRLLFVDCGLSLFFLVLGVWSLAFLVSVGCCFGVCYMLLGARCSLSVVRWSS